MRYLTGNEQRLVKITTRNRSVLLKKFTIPANTTSILNCTAHEIKKCLDNNALVSAITSDNILVQLDYTNFNIIFDDGPSIENESTTKTTQVKTKKVEVEEEEEEIDPLDKK